MAEKTACQSSKSSAGRARESPPYTGGGGKSRIDYVHDGRLLAKFGRAGIAFLKARNYGAALDKLPLPQSVRDLEAKLKHELSKDLFVRIRNNASFHYSEKLIDLSRLKDANVLTEVDAHLYVTEPGYNGDMLSYLSTLASIEPVLHLNPNPGYVIALREVITDIQEVSELYCNFVCDTLAVLIQDAIRPVVIEDVIIPDAPEANKEELLRFFLHPPSNLEEMRSSLV